MGTGWAGDAWIVAATVLGPLAAVAATLWGQARLSARDRARRAERVRVAVGYEVDANLRTADAVRGEVGEATRAAADRLRAADRLARRGVPVWERDAYTSLLPELPEAIATDEAMRDLAEHYARLREMDWCQRQLSEPGLAAVGDDDRRLMLWERYAAARERVGTIGNPLRAGRAAP